MQELISFDVLFVTSIKGRDMRIAIITFNNPQHFWNTSSYPWGTQIEEHRFNPAFLGRFSKVLDDIESDSSIGGLILTGQGRFFSNGFDTEFMKDQPGLARKVQKDFEKLMGRVISLPAVTAAALNGHTVGAGAILSLSCDARFMTEAGLFFVPAVDLGIVYSQGMIELMKSKITDSNDQRDFILLSKRYSSVTLTDMGLVESVCTREALLDTTIDWIKSVWKQHASSLSEIRRRMYGQALRELESDHVSDMWLSKF